MRGLWGTLAPIPSTLEHSDSSCVSQRLGREHRSRCARYMTERGQVRSSTAPARFDERTRSIPPQMCAIQSATTPVRTGCALPLPDLPQCGSCPGRSACREPSWPAGRSSVRRARMPRWDSLLCIPHPDRADWRMSFRESCARDGFDQCHARQFFAPVAQGIEHRFPKASRPIPADPQKHDNTLENKLLPALPAVSRKRPQTSQNAPFG